MNTSGLGLALGSGGARGLAHIGVLKVFERERLPIHMIAGTSIGAVIGGAYAIGRTPQEIEAVALSTNTRRLVSLLDIARPTTALVNGFKVKEFIREIVEGKSFADTRIPFECVTVDVVDGKEIVLRDGDLASAIRASISIPVVFAPVQQDGQLLVDGAILNPVPVDVARHMGADVVIAVTPLGIPRYGMPVYCNDTGEDSIETGTISPSVIQLAVSSVDLMQRELSEPRLKAADLVIAPRIDGPAYSSFYEPNRIIAAGEEATEAALGEIRELLAARQISQPHPST